MKYLNSKKLRRKFSAAAQTYDDAAVLQREVADRLLERFEFIKDIPDVILDTGCGTGYCTRVLNKIYPKAFITGFDIAYPMLKLAKEGDQIEYFSADAHLIPVKSNSIDLIISNLVLQWCDQRTVFNEFARILKPGGLLMFTTFGPDTLIELREAWGKVDNYQHVHDFTDMHNIGDALLQCGLAEPVMDKETITLTYENVSKMIKDLRNIGASNAIKGQFKGLTGKDKFARFTEAYKSMAMDMSYQGKIPASYEIIYGQAWGSENFSASQLSDQVSHKKIISIQVQHKPR